MITSVGRVLPDLLVGEHIDGDQFHPGSDLLREPHRVIEFERGLKHRLHIIARNVRAGFRSGIKEIRGVHSSREGYCRPAVFPEKTVKIHAVFFFLFLIKKEDVPSFWMMTCLLNMHTDTPLWDML